MTTFHSRIDGILVRALEWFGVPAQIVGSELPAPLMVRYHLCFVDRLPAWPFLRILRCRDGNDRKRQKLVLHRTLRGDDRKKGIHSHPWRFWSVVFLGWYRETYVVIREPRTTTSPGYFATLTRTRGPLSAEAHEATYEHIIDAVSASPCWTLALLGPVTNAWGFPFVGETVRDANGEKVPGFNLENTR